MRRFILVAVIGLSSGVGSIRAQAPCAVRGVWVQESETSDGKAVALGQRRSMKLLTANHWAFISEEPGATGPKAFGGGTYRVAASTITERLEYFYDSKYLNREVTATCRVTGDRWYHAFQWPVFDGARETGRVQIEEVWRRIE